jgi:hypothetical protein
MAGIDPGTVGDAEAETVARRARDYPFPAPDRSYIYYQGEELQLVDPVRPLSGDARVMVDGRAVSLDDVLGGGDVTRGELTARRTAVLAYGSNASVETLRRKFDDSVTPTVIPAIRGTMADFDVVYSAHFFAGTIPATLQHSPGTSFQPFVLYMTGPQLGRMHETESVGENYDYVRLDGVDVTLETCERVDSLTTYISISGAVCVGGTEIAVADVAADGRRFRALTQVGVQHEMKRALAENVSLDSFMRENASEPAKAQARSQFMREHACELRWPHLERLSG